MNRNFYSRPYATYYYDGLSALLNDKAGHGAAKTLDGARRATVVRMMMWQYTKAIIVDRNRGQIVLCLKRHKKSITIAGLAA
jgi:hypothetical protein